MVANNTTLLYAVAPLVGFGGVPVAVVFTGILVAGPLGEAFTLGEALTLGKAFTFGEAFTLSEVLFASPLHLLCSQHVASHFLKVIPGCSCEALQDFAWRSWHIDCVKIEIRKKKINDNKSRKE